MNFVLLLCVTQVVWGKEWNFYHKLPVKTFQPPTSLPENSYFGFSTTYYQYNKRMIISAPKENNIGEVYECDLSNPSENSCSKLDYDIKREDPLYKHDYWFGATVKAGPKFVVACAPRYSKIGDIQRHCLDSGTYGHCFIRQENETHFRRRPIVTQLYQHTPNRQSYGHFYYCFHLEKSMDTLGWSLDIGADSSMIVGGPGLFNTTGTAVTVDSNWLRGASRIEHILYRVTKTLYNFGYSVAMGYFLNTAEISYAVSTTYGVDGSGKVFIYWAHAVHPFTLIKGADTEVVGSMFGAVLCAAKCSKDTKKDGLLVGAPTYAVNTGYNTGAVYVYGGNVRSHGPPEYVRKIVGQMSGSMFGRAIISVGDLNSDGIDEIAIGAPFEGNGAVYLYSGAALFDSTEQTLTWLQRIEPSDKSIMSFGYSMTALQDYDDNGCNELSVSAPFSDRVMVYKCWAAVTVTILAPKFPEVKNRTLTHQTDFEFQVCLKLEYPKKLKNAVAVLSTDVKMDHLKLKNVSNSNVYTFKTQLQNMNATYCENVGIILPLDKEHRKLIKYEIKTELLNKPMTLESVTDDHVVISDNSKLFYSDVWSLAE